MSEPNWLAIGLLLGAIAYHGIGILLAAWRQPNDEMFLIAMIMWAFAPFWIWLAPVSRTLRQVIASFWRGMDWKPY
jgi:hypothetical protein